MSGAGATETGARFGAAQWVKGGACVRLPSAEPAVADAPDSQPIISEREAAQAGLFRPRLIEFGEARHETVVAARPEIRETLIVARSVESRVERVEDKVRRTEVEIEQLPPRADEEVPGFA